MARARVAAGVAFSARELESSSLIDWRVSAQVKMAVLRCLFEDLAATDLAANPILGLASDFANFCDARGSALQQHAAFEALHQARLKTNPETSNWQDWPATWRDPRSATVGEFIAKNRREILFHCFLQWLAERSFAGSQKEARRAGMRIGLIADLAVGMNSSGSYAWAHQGQMLGGLRIGAPPDAFNAKGQNWDLTLFSPQALHRERLSIHWCFGVRALHRSLRHFGHACVTPVACASITQWDLCGFGSFPRALNRARERT